MTVAAALSITVEGTVSDAQVSGGNAASRACVRKTLEALTFPVLGSPTKVTIPRVFGATEAEVGDVPVPERPAKADNAAMDRVMAKQAVEIASCGRLASPASCRLSRPPPPR